MKYIRLYMSERKMEKKFDVRVVVETKGYGEWDWRRMVLVQLDLTLEQRNRLIANLAWLRNV